jgi:REP element-mobilizing transposase RayT
MKRVRITYEGAFHHVMNRGINGEEIFSGHRTKSQFLDFLEEYSKKMRIRIVSYCIMNNHYHLILENSSGRMSDFCRDMNGTYGMYYRKLNGGKGYVFQSRFRSTLIQDDSYLKMAIAYVLLNPVRAGIVEHFTEYIWSSASHYFSDKPFEIEIVDTDFVNELFVSKSQFFKFMELWCSKELPIRETKYGGILGAQDFLDEALDKFDRRGKLESEGVKRIDDRYFEPEEKVIWEFETKHGLKLEEIDTRSYKGKRLRGELLVLLKDLAGLKYTDIMELPIFRELLVTSLPKLYRDAKKRGWEKGGKDKG